MHKLGYSGRVFDSSMSSNGSATVQGSSGLEEEHCHTAAGTFRPRDRPVSAKYSGKREQTKQRQRPLSATLGTTRPALPMSSQNMGGPYAVLLKHKGMSSSVKEGWAAKEASHETPTIEDDSWEEESFPSDLPSSNKGPVSSIRNSKDVSGRIVRKEPLPASRVASRAEAQPVGRHVDVLRVPQKKSSPRLPRVEREKENRHPHANHALEAPPQKNSVTRVVRKLGENIDERTDWVLEEGESSDMGRALEEVKRKVELANGSHKEMQAMLKRQLQAAHDSVADLMDETVKLRMEKSEALAAVKRAGECQEKHNAQIMELSEENNRLNSRIYEMNQIAYNRTQAHEEELSTARARADASIAKMQSMRDEVLKAQESALAREKALAQDAELANKRADVLEEQVEGLRETCAGLSSTLGQCEEETRVALAEADARRASERACILERAVEVVLAGKRRAVMRACFAVWDEMCISTAPKPWENGKDKGMESTLASVQTTCVSDTPRISEEAVLSVTGTGTPSVKVTVGIVLASEKMMMSTMDGASKALARLLPLPKKDTNAQCDDTLAQTVCVMHIDSVPTDTAVSAASSPGAHWPCEVVKEVDDEGVGELLRIGCFLRGPGDEVFGGGAPEGVVGLSEQDINGQDLEERMCRDAGDRSSVSVEQQPQLLYECASVTEDGPSVGVEQAPDLHLQDCGSVTSVKICKSIFGEWRATVHRQFREKRILARWEAKHKEDIITMGFHAWMEGARVEKEEHKRMWEAAACCARAQEMSCVGLIVQCWRVYSAATARPSPR